jgi:2-(1,2-epoxy-1,2-dihydrophenyl)acetyl-CoA isomerase
LEALGRDSSVRSIVLQANGRSFSTGGDLLGFCEHQDDLASYATEIVGALNEVILLMIYMPVPIIAAVHGIVTGGSLGLVLGSDIVLVSPNASFTPYYARVGFSPDGGWVALLPSVIGAKRAAEILYADGTISAYQAAAWGLASRVVEDEDVRQEALNLAQRIATRKPGSVRHAKRLFAVDRNDLSRRLEAERRAFVEHIISEEARQGIRVFLARD